MPKVKYGGERSGGGLLKVACYFVIVFVVASCFRAWHGDTMLQQCFAWVLRARVQQRASPNMDVNAIAAWGMSQVRGDGDVCRMCMCNCAVMEMTTSMLAVDSDMAVACGPSEAVAISLRRAFRGTGVHVPGIIVLTTTDNGCPDPSSTTPGNDFANFPAEGCTCCMCQC